MVTDPAAVQVQFMVSQTANVGSCPDDSFLLAGEGVAHQEAVADQAAQKAHPVSFPVTIIKQAHFKPGSFAEGREFSRLILNADHPVDPLTAL